MELELQKTIAQPISYIGIGLHTGQDATITCLPAPENSGILFCRVDLPGKPLLRVHANNIVSTRRCTSIGCTEEQWSIHTIEHLMAAISMAGIDNLIIELDSEEPPVTDGSAIIFLDLFKKAGLQKQAETRQYIKISRPIYVREKDATLIALPYDGFRITYTLSYDHPVIRTQYADYEITEDLFYAEIARARTFGFACEIEVLHKRGLALGGSLDNAVLIHDKGTVNPLRYPDEFVRHKVLDMVGDLAVNGRVLGHFIGIKSGHSLNAKL